MRRNNDEFGTLLKKLYPLYWFYVMNTMNTCNQINIRGMSRINKEKILGTNSTCYITK